jgi:lipopolysaccharide export system protein LptA
MSSQGGIQSMHTKSKFRAPMKRNSLILTLTLLTLLTAGAVRAEKADRDKPMNIESDAMRYDDLRQINVFSGRVILTKGSIVIRGETIEVRQDPQGYQLGWVTGSAQTPAFFRQKRDGVDEYIEGEALSIEYDGRADTVKFVQQAQMRRLRGATLVDEVKGNVIVYENLTDIFRVDGGAKTAGGPAGGRVRAMLSPKTDSTSGPTVAPSKPLQLRPADALERQAQ